MAVALNARVSKAKQAEKALYTLTSYGKCATGASRRAIALRWNTLNRVPLQPTTSGQYFSR